MGFLLRLPKTLYDEAKLLAKADGVSMNHFISLAVAEKLTRFRVEAEAAQVAEVKSERLRHRVTAEPKGIVAPRSERDGRTSH